MWPRRQSTCVIKAAEKPGRVGTKLALVGHPGATRAIEFGALVRPGTIICRYGGEGAGTGMGGVRRPVLVIHTPHEIHACCKGLDEGGD